MDSNPLPPSSSFFVNRVLTAKQNQLVVNQGFGTETGEVANGSLWAAQGNLPQQAAKDNKTRPNGTQGAWVWSSTQWDSKKEEKLVMLINPENVQWTIPFRLSRVNTFGGTIFHRWQNFNQSPVDLPVLKIRMNTGNIMNASEMVLPSQGVGPSQLVTRNRSAVQKQAAFFRFCSLAHQPAFTKTGEPNLVSIQYRSVLFGQVTLYVIFTDPLGFTEDAMKPFNVQYDIGVTVLAQMPDFTTPQQFTTSLLG